MKNTPWDDNLNRGMIRRDPNDVKYELENGVKYFILKLEALGIKTISSCEGHPTGFFIAFQSSYELAKRISDVSIHFDVSIANIINMDNMWALSILPHSNNYETRNYILRKTSVIWQSNL